MSGYDRRRGNDGSETGKMSAGGGRSPGRRTLTEQLPVRKQPASEQASEPESSSQTDPRMTEKERTDLLLDARIRISNAFSAFGNACVVERAAVKEAAKDGHAIFELLFDTAMGLLMPGVGKAIAHAVKTASLPVVQRLAETIGDKCADLLKHGVGQVKEHLTATSPADVTEVDAFLTGLAAQEQIVGQAIGEGLRDQPDAVIVATWAAFDGQLVNVTTYGKAIHDLVMGYKKTVAPIGRPEQGGRGSGDWRIEGTDTMMAYETTVGLVPSMVLVERRDRSDTGEQTYRVIEWIPPELQNAARGKVRAVTGKEMASIPYERLSFDPKGR